MKKKYKRCSQCKLKKSSVKRRKCGFVEEVHGKTQMEQVCNECENDHLDDI